ncbi:MAG: DUF3375 family protein [Limnobacter sp.]|nr:DUF3375 family protein [Limnobacter sp.]
MSTSLFQHIQTRKSQSAGLALLRSEQLAEVLTFVEAVFANTASAIPFSQASKDLEELFKVLAVQGVREPTDKPAKYYLSQWVQNRWIATEPNASDPSDKLVNVPTEILEVLNFVSNVGEVTHVGAKTRLGMFVNIAQLFYRSLYEDRHKLAERLRREIASKQNRLAELEAGHEIELASDNEIQELFQETLRDGESFINELKYIGAIARQKDQEIRKQVSQKALEGLEGAQLVFEALESLRTSQQYESFDAFYDMLGMEREKRELFYCLSQVLSHEKIRVLEPARRQRLKALLPRMNKEASSANERFGKVNDNIRIFAQSQGSHEFKQAKRAIAGLMNQVGEQELFSVKLPTTKPCQAFA